LTKADELARHSTLGMPAYIAGTPKEEIEKKYGIKNTVKLASNENPLKVSPKVIEAISREAKNCYMYPEGTSPELREALAANLGVRASQIIVGNGGDHVIGLLCHAFVEEGDDVIVGSPSFRTYAINTAIMGGNLVRVPLKDLTLDPEGILNAITERTKLIFFCNPNNPTGTIVKKDRIRAFMRRVPERCIVVFDEAYHEFVADPDYPDSMEYVRAGRNVFILRTFSKVYGLAGLRVGYCIASEELAQTLGRVLPAFPVNRLAQAAALAALEDQAFVAATLENNTTGKEYLYGAFDKLGLHYAETETNFIFVDIKMPAKTAYENMLHYGVIVRPCDQWDMPTCLRVTIGTMDENKKMIDALIHVLDQNNQ